jgi:hypothetical protein
MKKSILTVIIVMILAVSTVLLTACGTKMFPVNEERANKQVTATVEYGGRIGIVSVEELYNRFYSTYNTYYTYYQYGYVSEAAFQEFLDNMEENFENYNKSLAKTSLYTLKCIETMNEFYTKQLGADNAKVQNMAKASTKGHTNYNFNNMDDLNKFYAERIAEMETILACYQDYSYLNSAIRSANKDMQESFDKYLETVKAEYAALEGTSKDTTPEGYTAIVITDMPYRLIYEVDSDATLDTRGLKVVAKYADGTTCEIPTKYLTFSGFSASAAAEDQVITVTYGQKSTTFKVNIVAARPDREQPAKVDAAEDNSQPVAKFVVDVDAVKKSDYVKEGMTDAEKADATQEYKFARNAMSRLKKSLEDNYHTYDSYLYGYLTEQLLNLTEATVGADIKLTQAELDTEYERLLGERKATLAVKDFTKSDVETAANALLQPDFGDSYGYYYVTQIYFAMTEEQTNLIDSYKSAGNASASAIQNYINQKAKEISVWKSNPDYDADAECELEACTCPHCKNYVLPEGAEAPSFKTLDDWYTCVDNCPCVACPSKKYIYNPDSEDGSYNVMDIIDAIEADLDAIDTTLSAAEYRKSVIDTVNNWAYYVNEDPGIFTNITDQKLGYLMTPEGESSGMDSNFDKTSRKLAEYKGKVFTEEDKQKLAAEGIFIETDEGGVGSYAWCVTYTDKYKAVFFIVLTAYAVEDEGFGTVTDVDGYKQLGLDYVYNSIKYDADNGSSGLSVLNNGTVTQLRAGTIAAEIGSDLLKEKVSANYSNFQKEFVTKYEDDIKYNAKGYQYLLKKLKGED